MKNHLVPAPASSTAIPELRKELLRGCLLATLDHLHRRRAADIPEGYIDDYGSLRWLEWHGGGLRITVTGENVCQQARDRLQH